MPQSIAITGQGIICAIGVDCESVLSSLKKEEHGISQIKYLESIHKELPAGEVKLSDNQMKDNLGLPSDREVSRTSLFGAIALKQAMKSSGLKEEDLAGKRVVLISGTTVGGMDVTERHYPQMLSDKGKARYVGQHDCGNNTKEIAELCGIEADLITISTACSSALNAIILGSRLLLADKVDIVLAGGSEALSRFHLNGFNSLMILDHESCLPFDCNRHGLNLGEGAAYVVLERTTDLSKRDVCNPIAFIAGYGNRCDAFHQTATSENGEGAYLAMTDAIAMSGINPSEIDYINAHGTGTPDNDRSESQAIFRVFGESYPPVSSTKAFTGHTTSASGSIETVICMLSMHNNFIPANLRWQQSSEDCIIPSKGQQNVELHNVMCNSFGFGGNESSLILSRTPVLLDDVKDSAEYGISSIHEITNTEDLSDVKKYVTAMEARRMSKVMKAAILTSMQAIESAGIQKPDAIVIGTAYGMLDQGEKILNHIEEEGEEGLSPTLFMQSTHNTIAGTLATRLKCHGYNITYSQGEDSWDLAISDAKQLISERRAENILVGLHDYCPEHFRQIFEFAGIKVPAEVISRSVIVSKHKIGKEEGNE